MVELSTRPLDLVLDRWWDATCEALQAGATKEDLYHMLKTRLDPAPVHNCGNCLPDSQGPDKVFTELPEGLIDLPSAAKKYGINQRTMYNWVHRGRVKARGRLRAPTTGGGYLAVCEDELVTFMERPRDKGGRPKGT